MPQGFYARAVEPRCSAAPSAAIFFIPPSTRKRMEPQAEELESLTEQDLACQQQVQAVHCCTSMRRRQDRRGRGNLIHRQPSAQVLEMPSPMRSTRSTRARCSSRVPQVPATHFISRTADDHGDESKYISFLLDNNPRQPRRYIRSGRCSTPESETGRAERSTPT